MQEEVFENNKDILHRLSSYQYDAVSRKAAHYYMSNRAQNYYNVLGFCVTVLSTIVGTAIFAAISKKNGGNTPDNSIGWVTGIISVLATALSSVHTFLGFSGVAEKNKKAALQYEIISNQIDSILLKNRLFNENLTTTARAEVLEKIEQILSEFIKASASAPNIPERVAKKYSITSKVIFVPK